jgi:hypothetical protein
MVHFRNKDPLAVGREPGAVCHTYFIGGHIHVTLPGAALLRSNESDVHAGFDLRKEYVLLVNPGERCRVGQYLLRLSA